MSVKMKGRLSVLSSLILVCGIMLCMSMAVSAESLSGSISVSSLKVNDVLTYGITNITDISEYTVTLQGNRHYLFNNVVTNDTVLTDFTIFYDNSSSYGGVEFRPTGQSQGWYIPYDGTDITTEWLVVAVDHSQKTLTLAGVPDHTHNITYSASGATITAICNDTSCELHNSPATLTLSAADASYSGSAYAGASLTDTTAWTGAGLTAPTIEYEGRGNTSYTKSETAPANAGTYTASITVDTDKTATVDFTISKAAPGTPTVTMSDYTYSGTVSTPSIGTYSGEGAVTYYYSTTNSASGGTAWENITATTLEAKTYYMYAVIAESDNYNSYTTATTSFTISKADQTAPDAPTKASATASSITLTEITNGEYKRNNGEWQTSPTFTGLEMNTPYTFYQRLKEDDNHNASPASQSAEISTPNHTHNWSYQASGDTITATCGNDDGEHGTPLTATLTINAPTLIYVGQTGDGISAQASITDENSIKGDAVISYFNANEAGTAKDGSALSSAPTDAGKYWAEITLGTGGNTATAHVVYSIGYAVTFNTNGGSEVPMQVVRKGESATRPAAPTKAGNIFGDWYADSEYNETYRFGSSVNTNTTVHAKWGTHEVEWVFYTGSIASYSIRDVFSGTAPAVDSISDVIVSMLDETRPAATTVVGWKTETDASGNVTYYRVLMKSPTAKSLTYTGSAQELVNAGVVYGSEMQYALGTDDQTAPTQDWTTDIPTGNEAKTYFVWYKAIGDSGFSDSAAACIKVTISNPYTPPVKPKPTTDTEEYTIPVENNNTVDVGAEIQSGTAVISEITDEDLSKVTSNDNTGCNGNTPGSGAGDNSQIVIDLSGAKQEVVACELTKQSLERLADTAESNSNQVDSVKIQMTNATVELDGKALNAIADQATGSSIKLVVEDTQHTKLNQAQQNALSKYSSVTSFEAYFESNGARIHNFKGGKATVSMKFKPDKGRSINFYHVFYLDPTGKMDRYITKYINQMLMFITGHFSDYAIVYDETLKNATEEADNVKQEEDKTGDNPENSNPENSNPENSNSSGNGTTAEDASNNGNGNSSSPENSTKDEKPAEDTSNNGNDNSSTPENATKDENTANEETQPSNTEEEDTLALNGGLKVSQSGTTIKVAWGKVKGAGRYEVYATYCGTKFKNPVKTVSGSKDSVTIKKLNGKKIDLTKNYKVYVVAYKASGTAYIKTAKSITAHIVGAKNTKFSNVKSISLSKKKFSLKEGGTATLKASCKLVDPKKRMLSDAHAPTFRYASTDKNVATVSSKGKITAKGKGTCYVYVYAKNGYAKKAKVTVK